MTRLVSIFRDRAAAETAALRLAQAGIPDDRVHLRDRPRVPVNETAIQVDEYVAGGIFHDVGKLLDDLLDHEAEPEKAATYDDAVRMGEQVAVIVDADGPDEVERADAVLRESGARHVVRH
jgi:hypothetical protein